MIHKMRLVDFAFRAIKCGSKDIEVRLNDEKRKLIKKGDIIEFKNLDTEELIKIKVINLYHFNNFKELYNMFGNERLGIDDLNIIDSFYSKEEQNKYRFLAIEIKLII